MNIMFDVYDNPEPFKAYLATPSKKILGCLNGIDETSGSLRMVAKDTYELTFTVHRFIDGIETPYYNDLGKLMRIKIPNIGWFIMDEPSTHNTGKNEYKEITCNSEEYVFIQSDLREWRVNCGTTDSLEMLAKDNVEIIGGVEFAKEQIKFYNEKNPQLSLLNLLLADNPEWSIGYVDATPKKNANGKYTLLKDEIGKFDVANQSKFAFMTQDLPQYFECILVFDINNLVVNAYRVENIGKDTNILLDFKNVENSNSVTVDPDSVYTRYTVSGENNLGITFCNFGSNQIENIEYFLRTDVLDQTLINKYKAWYEDMRIKRKKYVELSKAYNKQLNVISELEIRVPLDGCNQNWYEMTELELQKAKDTYTAQLKGYEKFYVDENGKFDQAALDASPDAKDYYQIKNVILPNIDIAMHNREVPDSTQMDEYIDSWKTDWKLYGLNELTANLKSYQSRKEVLRQNHYDLSYEEYSKLTETDAKKYPPHTKDGHKNGYEEYVKINNQLDGTLQESLQWYFDKVTAEHEAEKKKAEQIAEERKLLVESIDKRNWESNEYGRFSKDELTELGNLYIDTDYQNTNVLITNLDGTDEVIDTQLKLLELAENDLEIVSQPQYKITANIDNFLSKIDYQDWSHELDLFNFIHLNITDDIKVKLRLSSISFNPFLMDNSIDLTFTNMLQSRTKRNDLAELIASSSGHGKNTITRHDGGVNSTDASVFLTPEFIQKIVNSSIFDSAVNNNINNNIIGGVGGGSGDITLEELNAKMIKVTDLFAENGFFEYLQAKLITADKIVADSGNFKELSAMVGMIDNLISGNVSAELGHIIQLTAENVNIDQAVIRDLIASQITVSMLQAGTISADKFNIASDDGGMSIVGNTMQFKDKSGNMRIQIGRDAKDNFTFVLYDETGKGVLIDSTGIKESAISNGLIKNDMVANGTLSKDKLNFHTVEADANGNVDASKVIINGQGIDTEFTTIRQEITTVKPYSMNIYSSNGTVFKRGCVDTYLMPVLYLGQENITDLYPPEHFKWTRQSDNSDDDMYWNSAHKEGTKSLHITTEDVFRGASFTCAFYIDNKQMVYAIF